MDRAFLEYYEDELAHIRGLAGEFSDLHPAVARNLSIDTAPCPDPYVERLLEGVAFLTARTRLKLDAEAARFTRTMLEFLYPDLAAPGPAAGMVQLVPGGQVEGMADGHVVRRGARLVSALREGLSTRCVYTTRQDVTLWPIRIAQVDYLQDRAALSAAGIAERRGAPRAAAAFRLQLERTAGQPIAGLGLDRLDLHLRRQPNGAALFDALFGRTAGVLAGPAGRPTEAVPLGRPQLVGLADGDAMLPRTRPTFEGYRILREYFLLPERFHYLRLEGLAPAVRACSGNLEITILLERPAPEIAGVGPDDLQLFVTPVVNLFHRECGVIDLDRRRSRQVVHADRTRTRDFEIYALTRVEDAERDGPEAEIPPLFSLEAARAGRPVYVAERRPRQPGEDERRAGQTRTSYVGDDVWISVTSRAEAPWPRSLQRIETAALCTNRDLPLLDPNPQLTLDGGDPVDAARLLGPVTEPRPSLAAVPPRGALVSDRLDDLTWRLGAQLSLNYLSLAGEGRGAETLAALLALYADRGDPRLTRRAGALRRVSSRPVLERLPLGGPACFGRGIEIDLEFDEAQLSGGSRVLLGALLDRLLARHAAVNSFVRTRMTFVPSQEEVAWPMTLGTRRLA